MKEVGGHGWGPHGVWASSDDGCSGRGRNEKRMNRRSQMPRLRCDSTGVEMTAVVIVTMESAKVVPTAAATSRY